MFPKNITELFSSGLSKDTVLKIQYSQYKDDVKYPLLDCTCSGDKVFLELVRFEDFDRAFIRLGNFETMPRQYPTSLTLIDMAYPERYTHDENYQEGSVAAFEIFFPIGKTGYSIWLRSKQARRVLDGYEFIADSPNRAAIYKDGKIIGTGIPSFFESFHCIDVAKKSLPRDSSYDDIIKEKLAKMNQPGWFASQAPTKNVTKAKAEAPKVTPVVPAPDTVDTVKKESVFSKLFKSFRSPAKEKTVSEQENEIREEINEAVDGRSDDMASLKIIEGTANPKEELKHLVGLGDIQGFIDRLEAKVEFDKKRAEQGVDTSASSMHMTLLGSPGTGKTTIARIFTSLYYQMGLISENRCVEVNGLELIAPYVGQTGTKTKKIIDAAKGGILFIDEAYAITDSGNHFGNEAISVLLKEMEDNRDNLIVFFAGYKDNMEDFLESNPGFKSRINANFELPDYTLSELAEILIRQLGAKHLKMDAESLERALAVLKKAMTSKTFGNARFVRNLVEAVENEHAIKTVYVPASNAERLDTVTAEDFPLEIAKQLLTSL